MLNVVIPTFNLDRCPARTASFLFIVARLCHERPEVARVTVVRQGSGSDKALGFWDHSKLRVLDNPEGHDSKYVHLAQMRNWGVLNTDGKYILILDSDVWVDIDEILKACTDDLSLKKPYRWCYRATEGETNTFYKDRRLTINKEAEKANTFGGGAVLCSRDAFLSVRGYDEDFTGWCPEDTDLFYRASKKPGLLSEEPVPAPAIHLWHPPAMDGDTNRTEEVQPKLDYHMACSWKDALRSVKSCIPMPSLF